MGGGFGLLPSNPTEMKKMQHITMNKKYLEACKECQVNEISAAILWHTTELDIMDFSCQCCAANSGHPWIPVIAE